PLSIADKEVIVTAGNEAQFRKLCEVIGAPELADDPRFAANEGRTANRDELRPLLAQRLAARTAAEWFDELIAAGVPAGPINTVDARGALAPDIRPRAVVTAGEGEAGTPTGPPPPPPPPSPRRAGRAPVSRSAPGCPGRPARLPRPSPRIRPERAHDAARRDSPFPHLTGRLRPGHDHPARPRPRRRPHGQGFL